MTKSKIISIIKSMNEDDFEDFSEAFEEHIVASDYHKQFLRHLEIYKSENNLINLYNLVETLLKRDKCKIKEIFENETYGHNYIIININILFLARRNYL